MIWFPSAIGQDLKMEVDKPALGLMVRSDMVGLDVKLVLDKVD